MPSTWRGLMAGGFLLALFCSVALAELDARLDKHWGLWKAKYQRKYHNKVEEVNRRAVWEKNLLYINIHNLEASLGLHTYTKAMNHMGDLTKEEALQKYATLRIPKDLKRTGSPFKATAAAPERVDWRESGYVTSVKNQGACGSCWAFSVAGAMEGHLARTTGKLVDLSPQQMVDCAGDTYGNYGCNGGYMDKAFQYVIDRGLESEASYPYRAEDGVCKYNKTSVEATCTSYGFLEKGSEAELKDAVAVIGPVSVGIDADDMMYYSGGIFDDPSCDTEVDHGVLVVGYGRDDVKKMDYWLVKNSWGTGWGEDGYIRIARNDGDMCLIATYATFCNN